MITVPEPNHEKLKALLIFLAITEQAFFVPVIPDNQAQCNECFDNVAAKLEKEGGERIVGWQIWEHPFLLEAEYHAVWKTPAGQLIDITPKNLPMNSAKFIKLPLFIKSLKPKTDILCQFYLLYVLSRFYQK